MGTDKAITKNSISITIKGQQLMLLAEKAIFWVEKSYLILTDVHLGKAGHFRKAGIPIPSSIHEADLQNLQKLVYRYKPKCILILGDLFHSEINLEWNIFRRFLDNNATYQFVLVKGNHDILPEDAYREDNLKVYEESWTIAPFYFTHHPMESAPEQLYYMAGHVHPGYKVRGKAGQSIKFPSFHFAKEGALLPAFGKFTGCVHVPKKQQDQVFIVVPALKKQYKLMKV
ncbi:DNA ligase-associated metallophosphoesterase [Catalinimonas alkaloidigena]|uniref:ligase-associated DNA damage response endonuclease PdeM n=1 Tax=Catalinimonas alkaloidigena TaxID=1075417 RepID=UPI002404AE9C|nr:ligase-associated DNA damage response endonuclease PdeM [Catalinimonas alkaloidigena]MDF9797735.1 DNA ligase-associated metallophosphoesterase [Catalinimonas alkaloidigena]